MEHSLSAEILTTTVRYRWSGQRHILREIVRKRTTRARENMSKSARIETVEFLNFIEAEAMGLSREEPVVLGHTGDSGDLVL